MLSIAKKYCSFNNNNDRYIVVLKQSSLAFGSGTRPDYFEINGSETEYIIMSNSSFQHLSKKINMEECDLHTIFQKYNAIPFSYDSNLYYRFKSKV